MGMTYSDNWYTHNADRIIEMVADILKYFIEAKFVDFFGMGELEFQEISDRRGRIDTWANYEKIYSEQEIKEQYGNAEGGSYLAYVTATSEDYIKRNKPMNYISVALIKDAEYPKEIQINFPKQKSKAQQASELVGIEISEETFKKIKEL